MRWDIRKHATPDMDMSDASYGDIMAGMRYVRTDRGPEGGGVRGVAWDPCETMPSEGGCLEDRQYDGRESWTRGLAVHVLWSGQAV